MRRVPGIAALFLTASLAISSDLAQQGHVAPSIDYVMISSLGPRDTKLAAGLVQMPKLQFEFEPGRPVRLWLLPDAYVMLDMCAPGESFVCAYATGEGREIIWAFAFPKAWTPTLKSWTHRGFKFHVVGRVHRGKLFGESRIDLVIFEVVLNLRGGTSQATQFLFDPACGVLAMSIANTQVNREVSTATYALEGKKCFGRPQ